MWSNLLPRGMKCFCEKTLCPAKANSLCTIISRHATLLSPIQFPCYHLSYDHCPQSWYQYVTVLVAVTCWSTGAGEKEVVTYCCMWIRVLLGCHRDQIYHLQVWHCLMDRAEECTGPRNSPNCNIPIPTCKVLTWSFLFQAKYFFFVVIFLAENSYYNFPMEISLLSHLSDQFWSSKPLTKSTRAWYVTLLNLD